MVAVGQFKHSVWHKMVKNASREISQNGQPNCGKRGETIYLMVILNTG